MEILVTIACVLLDVAVVLGLLLFNGCIVGLSILALKSFLEELRGDEDGS